MAKQTRQAVAEADVVIFVVDARGGLSAQDHDIAKYLRRLGKPCVLAANKAEGMTEGAQLAEFYELGLGEVYPVSAAHGQGIRSLVELALAPLNLPDEDEAEEEQHARRHQAGRGRPPQRGQVHPDQHLAGRGTPGGLRPAGHHARRDLACRSSATARSSS